LLEITLFAYSKGITSNREIQWSCETNIIYKALSFDTVPYFTTIANFVSSYPEEIENLFEQTLLVCHEQGLLGNELFAIETLDKAAQRIDRLLTTQSSRTGQGKKPKEVKSNITDNESGKMLASKGAIQGYNGVAVVDKKRQIVVDAHILEHKRKHNYTDWMKHRVDSDKGKLIYSHRMSVVEPVFGNIGTNKGL